MPKTAPIRKIATCCYCGTRAALVLNGDKAHELACSACGAPLHDLKQIPLARQAEATPFEKQRPRRSQAVSRDATRRRFEDKPRKKRKKFRIGKKIFEELWDVVEDIFD